MKKGLYLLVLVVLFGLFLTACKESDPTEPVETDPTTVVPALTAITFSGIQDGTQTIAYESEFNVLSGVTATGNNGVDYTAQITYTTTATVSSSHMLDTTKAGNVAIRYQVTVGSLVAQKWRYINVESPERPDGLVVNGDFSLGSTFWDDPSVVFQGDGGTIQLSVEDGALKAEVVAGANPWTPRFGQMGVPFEKDKAYLVTFDAKSTVEKTIQINFGELLAGPPYFTAFGVTTRKITTDWETYEIEFFMTADNPRGGILFELGTVGGTTVDATLWFDNIDIVETTPSEDTTAPVFSGLTANRSVMVGSTFDPMAGVMATDDRDGDVTADIEVVIKDGQGNVVTAVDTAATGTYELTYTVADSAGNEAEFVVTVEVVSLLFSGTNLVANPSFDTALDIDNPEWFVWSEGFTVTHGIDTTEGVYNVDISGSGPNPHSVQLVQENEFELVEGKTYRLMFNAKASVARKINVTAGIGLDADPWYITYMRQDGVQLSTDFADYEVLFTVKNATHLVKIVFEMGQMDGFAVGEVTFANVAIQEALLPAIVNNGNFDRLGWGAFWNDWEGTAGSYAVVDGEFVLTLTAYANPTDNWKLQFAQEGMRDLGLSTPGGMVLKPNTDYKLVFDAYASQAISLTPIISHGDSVGWSNLYDGAVVPITTTKATYTVEFSTGATVDPNYMFKFEFGTQFAAFTEGTEFVAFDNLSIKEDVASAPELLVNSTMTEVIGWSYDNAGGGQGHMNLVDGKAVVTVTDLGGEPYTPHMYQMIPVLAPGNYVLKLVLESSVTRDLRLNLVLPDAGWVSIIDGGFVDFEVTADEEEVVYVEFTVTNEVTNVKFELDFGTLGGTLVSLPGTFTISEVLIYQDLN